jgi:hypothetical protein
MSADDPFYTPGRKPNPRTARAGDHVWTLHRQFRGMTCELVCQGESYGWEARILADGDLRFSQRFTFREEALEFARRERADLEADG